MFAQVLKELVDAVPGATGAILADWEGESVAHYSRGDEYELKIIAAHKGIILSRMRQIHDQLAPDEMTETIISATATQVLTGALNRDYALIMTMARKTPLSLALRRFRVAIDLLRKEVD